MRRTHRGASRVHDRRVGGQGGPDWHRASRGDRGIRRPRRRRAVPGARHPRRARARASRAVALDAPIRRRSDLHPNRCSGRVRPTSPYFPGSMVALVWEVRCSKSSAMPSEQVRDLLAEFEPDRFDGAGARSLVEAFGELERLERGGQGARRPPGGGDRVVEAGRLAPRRRRLVGRHHRLHRRRCAGDARQTSSRLASLPSTEAALRAGTLSVTQVDAIADAASVDPGAELDLLERSEHEGVRGLRNECARVKAAACVDENERYERVRAARSLAVVDRCRRCRSDRHPRSGRRDRQGARRDRAVRRGAVRGGARRRSSRTTRRARLRCDRRAGRGPDRWRAEGARGVTGVVRIDHRALLRGWTEPGEVCEIVGQGPIPVAVASRLLDDAFLKAVVVDGTDIVTVSHLGRTIPARCAPRSRSCTASATSRVVT